MISRRLLLTGIAALTFSTPSKAAFFGFKSKAEKEAEAKAEAAEIKDLKKQLRLSKKKGKKLPADDLARLKDLQAREAKRLALVEKKVVKPLKQEPEVEVTRVSRRELARIKAEDEKLARSEIELKLSKRKPVLEARLEEAPKKVVRKIGKKTYTIDPKFEPQEVAFSGFPSGSIVINSQEKFLYFVETPFSARRYGVAVGKEGLDFHGTVVVGSKQEWPRWIPTKEMIERSPEKYAQYADGMDGGPNNPLGARAIYLYEGQKDTYLRIHGTTQPWTIGTAASNGCFRMVNEHVIDLFSRVAVGTKVTVL
jgi:lipoprotein-anchoring transpeptidase ErfK/SrfK